MSVVDHPQCETWSDAAWHPIDHPIAFGWSETGLARARDFASTLDTAAVMIVQDGALIAQWGDKTDRYLSHSTRKSIRDDIAIPIEMEDSQHDEERPGAVWVALSAWRTMAGRARRLWALSRRHPIAGSGDSSPCRQRH